MRGIDGHALGVGDVLHVRTPLAEGDAEVVDTSELRQALDDRDRVVDVHSLRDLLVGAQPHTENAVGVAALANAGDDPFEKPHPACKLAAVLILAPVRCR